MASNLLTKWWKSKFFNGYKQFSVECNEARISETDELLSRWGGHYPPNCSTPHLHAESMTTLATEATTVPPLLPELSRSQTAQMPPLTETTTAQPPSKESTSNSNNLKFEEFSCDVSVGNGGENGSGERKEFSFTLYDFDGHGKITKDDIAGLVTTIYEALGSSVKVPHYGSKTIKVKLTVSPDQRKHVSATIVRQNEEKAGGNSNNGVANDGVLHTNDATTTRHWTPRSYKRDLNVTVSRGSGSRRKQYKIRSGPVDHNACCKKHAAAALAAAAASVTAAPQSKPPNPSDEDSSDANDDSSDEVRHEHLVVNSKDDDEDAVQRLIQSPSSAASSALSMSGSEKSVNRNSNVAVSCPPNSSIPLQTMKCEQGVALDNDSAGSSGGGGTGTICEPKCSPPTTVQRHELLKIIKENMNKNNLNVSSSGYRKAFGSTSSAAYQKATSPVWHRASKIHNNLNNANHSEHTNKHYDTKTAQSHHTTPATAATASNTTNAATESSCYNTKFYVDFTSLQNATHLPPPFGSKQHYHHYDKHLDTMMFVTQPAKQQHKAKYQNHYHHHHHHHENSHNAGDATVSPVKYAVQSIPLHKSHGHDGSRIANTTKAHGTSSAKIVGHSNSRGLMAAAAGVVAATAAASQHTTSPHHQLRHRNRQEDQARAMAQVVHWLEQEFSNVTASKEKVMIPLSKRPPSVNTSPKSKIPNAKPQTTAADHQSTKPTAKRCAPTAATITTPNFNPPAPDPAYVSTNDSQISDKYEHRHLHEHIHHHYHHYQQDGVVASNTNGGTSLFV